MKFIQILFISICMSTKLLTTTAYFSCNQTTIARDMFQSSPPDIFYIMAANKTQQTMYSNHGSVESDRQQTKAKSENMVLLYYTPALHLQHRLNMQTSEELYLWI